MIPRLQSILFHKCPRCLEGDMYPDRNPYHLSQTAKMYSHCPKCNLNYQPEPGYFYGAMYVSYAFTVAVSAGVFLIDYLFLWELGIPFFLALLTVILAVLAPYTFRTSRAIWLNFFHRYRPEVRREVSGKPDRKVEII